LRGSAEILASTVIFIVGIGSPFGSFGGRDGCPSKNKYTTSSVANKGTAEYSPEKTCKKLIGMDIALAAILH
jgi:hypothetical protein